MAERGPSGGNVPLAEALRRVGLGALDADRREAARRFPFRLPRAYFQLADPTAPDDPILRMALPDARELDADPEALEDPVGESALAEVPFLVRKHRDRALLLVTARCHFYCRFCFRRTFPDGEHRDPTPDELAAALASIARDREVREVILSGGDPLVLKDSALSAIVHSVAGMPHVERLRVHTRAAVVAPERLTPALAALLASGRPCRVVSHFNHSVELSEAARAALDRLARAGIELLNQAVLLRGVNDDPGLLADLCSALARAGVRPYYLHHTDRAPGNGHFRVSLARGLGIFARLRTLGAGALPRYVIDLPDGSGKVDVEALEPAGAGRYRYRHPDGRTTSLDDINEA